MSKLKSWRTNVHLESYIDSEQGPILVEERIIIVVQAEKSGQATMKIINILEQGPWKVRLETSPSELVGINQLQLFTT